MNGPCASLPLLRAERNHHGGTMDPLHHSRGDDPDHTGVPTLPGQHDAPVACRIEIPLQHLHRLPQRLLIHLTPPPVLLLQHGGDAGGLTLVVGE